MPGQRQQPRTCSLQTHQECSCQWCDEEGAEANDDGSLDASQAQVGLPQANLTKSKPNWRADSTWRDSKAHSGSCRVASQ